MAKQTQKATLPSNKPRTSSSGTFLCCFGSSEDDEVPGAMSPPSKATGNRKRSRWFCWSLKVNSSAAKTVPVVDHANFSEKASSKDKTDVPRPSKSKSSKPAAEKVTGKRRGVFSGRKAARLSPAAATEPPDQEVPKQQTKGPAQSTVLDKRRVSDTRNETTGQKRRSFCRKTDAIRTRSRSQPGSPVEDNTQHNIKPSSTIRIGRVVSHPAATDSRRPAQTETDPAVGMSIILVTLMVMLLWGRVCAIISTSAWFYIIPRLSKSTKSSDRKHGHNNNHQNDSFWDEQGLSYEHKKRVVLEGFLGRNHHR